MQDRLPEQGRGIELAGGNLPPPTGRGSERFWIRAMSGGIAGLVFGMAGYNLSNYILRDIGASSVSKATLSVGIGLLLVLVSSRVVHDTLRRIENRQRPR